jgi:hypothetical protein
MDDSRVLVYDLEGKEWQVEVDTTTDVVVFAKSLLVEGASATAKLAEGHFWWGTSETRGPSTSIQRSSSRSTPRRGARSWRAPSIRSA